MKLSDIKNYYQYWAVADIWYQRAKSMNSIWQNDNETMQRRIKAYAIFIHYSQICLKMALHVNNIKRTYNYPKGGL